MIFSVLGLSVALGTLRTNVDARIETRSKLAGLFASQIGKDIMELMLDVNKLRDQVVVSSHHKFNWEIHGHFIFIIEQLLFFCKL